MFMLVPNPQHSEEEKLIISMKKKQINISMVNSVCCEFFPPP